MAKAITSVPIGYNVGFAPDKFFDATALANTGATTSEEFLFANTLGKTELQILANGAVATGAGESLVISVQTSATTGGTFAEVASYTVAASTTVADGGLIAAYVAPSGIENVYTKVVITSDYDASALAVDGVVVTV